jgi:hypothetical protein
MTASFASWSIASVLWSLGAYRSITFDGNPSILAIFYSKRGGAVVKAIKAHKKAPRPTGGINEQTLPIPTEGCLLQSLKLEVCFLKD